MNMVLAALRDKLCAATGSRTFQRDFQAVAVGGQPGGPAIVPAVHSQKRLEREKAVRHSQLPSATLSHNASRLHSLPR